MVSKILKAGLKVLMDNKTIFFPYIILGIILILGSLLISKPTCEIYQNFSFSSYTPSYDSYFFKKFIDIMLISVVYSIFVFIFTILANVAGLKCVKDYLNGQKTKISDMGKITFTKGFVAIVASLTAGILFFLPGIAGILIYLFTLSSMNSFYSSDSTTEIIGMLFAFLFMFFIQAIILGVFGYYILSGKFRKIYLILIIGIVIFFILSLAISAILPYLSFIFIIPLTILLLVLWFVFGFISLIFYNSITYIIPSAVVFEEKGVVDAIKSSINFAKDNTKKFSIITLIVIVIEIFISIPSFIISLASTLHPSYSLCILSDFPLIILSIFVYPYILSIFSITYALSKNLKTAETKDEVVGGLGH